MDQVQQVSENTRRLSGVFEILKKNNNDPARLIPILQEVQDLYRYLPAKVMSFIASSLRIPTSRVYGVATFYSHFALKPKGKHVIRVCDGTACHVKGSAIIADALRAHLKLAPGETNTSDMMFALDTVSCLGACGLAPVMIIDEKVYGQMTPAQACAIVDSLKKSEVRNDA
jgi:NADH-quinone oxidoreductase subunit E